MKLREIEEEFKEKLLFACIKDINLLKEEDYGKIYSYILYVNSGYTSFGSAYEAINKETTVSYEEEVKAFEYKNINYNIGVFQSLNNYVDEIFDSFYNETFEEIDLDMLSSCELSSFISGFFKESILQVIEKLKELRIFNMGNFSEGILLGVQFSDANEDQRKDIIYVSKEINSEKWHEKILKNFSFRL